jgi:archaellum component FlaC
MYSENDMKEFFQNVIDQVATLSTQASKVEGLEQRVQDMYNRLNELEQTNRELQEKLAQANATLDRVHNELDGTRREFDNERAVTQSLRETIVQGDQRVVSVEQSFRQEQEAHRITISERDDARQKASEQEDSLARAYTQYE